MLTDLRQDGAPRELDCDLCILGGGAAGITLSRALIGSGISVCVVEGGGLTPEPAVQALYDGDSVGQQNANPLSCRLRYFGGTTNHWMGWCAPLQQIDFATREWIPWSGWPVGAEELEPYYRRARTLCQLEASARPPEPRDDEVDVLAGVSAERLRVGHWNFSPPTRFGEVYREELVQAANVRVLLHANILGIDTDAEATSVTAVRVSTLEGRTASIRARTFVLACGGLENPRLLLACNQVAPRGLGNDHDLVGRFFMQHLEVTTAEVRSGDGGALDAYFRHHHDLDVPFKRHLSPSPAAQARHRMLNCAVAVHGTREYGAGYRALRRLWQAISAGRMPESLSGDVSALIRDLDGLAADLQRDARGEFEALTVRVWAEQAPNPDSRVRLSERRDPFGMPRVHVDWQLGPEDRHTLVAATHRLAEELGRLGVGRVRLEPWLREDGAPWPERIWSGCHHMGTTRMADDPRRGVVDANCRVHGVRNLYVAGSSVFPTGGYVPPTLTIVALALRLADRLKLDLRQMR